MIRTLHWHLSRELLRVTALALVALTLLMTIFGIVKPLREVGLATNQVLALFGYLVPVMLSLTLPVAALFAGTIVYGRFAQDNELLACQASGISTLHLLRPALVLGVLVTVTALTLSNFVAPGMMERAERSAKNNIAGIVFNQLQKSGYLRQEDFTIHADSADPHSRTLRGVVVIDTTKPEDIRIAMAASATISFDWHRGDAYATIETDRQVIGRTSDLSLVFQKSSPGRFLLPNMVQERPSWYNWTKLIRTLQNPAENQDIDRDLTQIKRRIGHDMLVQEIVAAIQAGKVYDKLAKNGLRYEIQAAGAHADSSETARLVSGLSGDRNDVPVRVRVVRDGKVEQIIQASTGKVTATWSEWSNASQVTIELQDNVVVRNFQPDQVHQRAQWAKGELDVPASIRKRADDIDIREIYSEPRRITNSPRILGEIDHLRRGNITKLLARIEAEMHSRISYGASCFLLVALGSGLGLLFRGGQFISAFAISLIPGTILIVLMLMGKELVKNPDLPKAMGLACIWSGIVILAAATSIVYLRLAKRSV